MNAVLALDTSGPVSFVTLRDSIGRVHCEAVFGGETLHEDVSLRIQSLLVRAETDSRALTTLLVGAGPGSFTGLRIGFSVMKGLAIALRIPLRALDSLHAAAAALDEFEGAVVVAADARRDEAFCGVYRRGWRAGQDECVELYRPHIRSWAGVAELASSMASQGEAVTVLSPNPEIAALHAVSARMISKSALGLLAQHDRLPAPAPFSVEGVSELSPAYLRAVAAKTIMERQQEGVKC